MKYFSTFSGIGGFEFGIQYAHENRASELSAGRLQHADGHEHEQERPERAPTCVGYSEIDKYAIEVYQRHFPEHKNYGDITKIKAEDLPEFDLFVGGFPCQSFSIAGKRGGFADTRGTLFFEICRILKERQPRLVLLENVKGLLSHDQGRTFTTIITTLDELGYDLQWQVLNSKNHGVPQNRERVFIAGHLRGTPRPEVFPFGSGHEEYIPETDEQGCASTLTSRSAGGENRRGNYIIHNVYGGFKEGVREFHDHAPCIRTAAGGGHIPMVSDDTKIRRLTPVECERLQGFPDNWTEGASDTQRYKMLGNAVTVNVIEDVCSKLLYAPAS